MAVNLNTATAAQLQEVMMGRDAQTILKIRGPNGELSLRETLKQTFLVRAQLKRMRSAGLIEVVFHDEDLDRGSDSDGSDDSKSGKSGWKAEIKALRSSVTECMQAIQRLSTNQNAPHGSGKGDVEGMSEPIPPSDIATPSVQNVPVVEEHDGSRDFGGKDPPGGAQESETGGRGFKHHFNMLAAAYGGYQEEVMEDLEDIVRRQDFDPDGLIPASVYMDRGRGRQVPPRQGTSEQLYHPGVQRRYVEQPHWSSQQYIGPEYEPGNSRSEDRKEVVDSQRSRGWTGAQEEALQWLRGRSARNAQRENSRSSDQKRYDTGRVEEQSRNSNYGGTGVTGVPGSRYREYGGNLQRANMFRQERHPRENMVSNGAEQRSMTVTQVYSRARGGQEHASSRQPGYTQDDIQGLLDAYQEEQHPRHQPERRERHVSKARRSHEREGSRGKTYDSYHQGHRSARRDSDDEEESEVELVEHRAGKSGRRGERGSSRDQRSSSRKESRRSTSRRHYRRSYGPGHGSTSDSDSVSEDDDRRYEDRRSSQKQRGPPIPKMQTFDGKSGEWEAFIFQFRQFASQYKWTEREKKEKLLACLRGKAVQYISSKPKKMWINYKELRRTLEDRYGLLELPSTARRQLGVLRQNEGESLEDFADRVMLKGGEGYPEVPEEVLQELVTEHFLRGCKDQRAAYAAAEKGPETIYEALQEMRDSMANLQMFGKSCLVTRQVQFSKSDGPMDLSEEDGRKLASFLADELEKRRSREPRPRGPTPPPRGSRSRSRSTSPGGRCFNCHEPGHTSRDCPKPQLCNSCRKPGHFSRDCPNKVVVEMKEAETSQSN